MSGTLPPDEWLRERLPEKLKGGPGEAFIGLLAKEASFQRLAFDLGFEWALAQLSSPVLFERHFNADAVSDADELLDPTRFVDDGFDTVPPSSPPDDAA